ncbi:carbohydrate porin [Lonepinella koalarum]|uniref:carbohydrate porin n=1 Tax=Lonepinella koalarum TaxID=53417 RepID=UPI003F6DF4DB
MKINHSKLMQGLCCSVITLGAITAQAETESQKPLSDVGNWLEQHGIKPHLMSSYLYFDNFDMGIQKGKNEQLVIVMAGFDADLQKLASIKGGNFHFSYAWAPYHKNFNFGSQAGDILVGNPPPYIPKVAHLTKLTYEQKLFDDRLSIEVGRSNPGFYYGKSLCNFEFSCVNPLLHKTAAFSPVIYSAWGGRVAYKLTPSLEFSASGWRTFSDYPFTNGWDNGWNSKHPTGNLWLAGLSRTEEWRNSQSKYPLTWELTFFHNTHRFVDADPLVVDKKQLSGVTGMYAGIKKLFWRLDDGSEKQPSATTLSAYASLSKTFDDINNGGLSSFVSAGVILNGPFKSRPMDSYGLNFNWAKVSNGQQRAMTASYVGNENWYARKNQYQLSVDATIPVLPSLIVQWSVGRVWHANNWMNANTGQVITERPKDGYSASLAITLLLDNALGLTK